MSYQLTYPVEGPSELAAVGALGSIWLKTVLRSKNTLALPVAGSMRYITPGRLTALVLPPAPREIAYSPLPNTPPGPATRRTMSPPNEESGVNSATEVIGADVEILVAVVFWATVIVPRSAFVVGVVVAVNVTVLGKIETKGAKRLRCSSGTGA